MTINGRDTIEQATPSSGVVLVRLSAGDWLRLVGLVVSLVIVVAGAMIQTHVSVRETIATSEAKFRAIDDKLGDLKSSVEKINGVVFPPMRQEGGR